MSAPKLDLWQGNIRLTLSNKLLCKKEGATKLIYVFLTLAILTEVTATLLLKASNGWEKWWFGMGAIFFYSIAGMILAFVLKSMNVGLAYAIWSGVGIALVCMASVFIWQQKFDIYALTGVLLIVVGTGLITLKSNVVLQ